MVQEQEAAKARFAQQKSSIEAENVIIRARADGQATIIRAKAEAESMALRSAVLQRNPRLLTLELIQRWDGKGPTVSTGAAPLLSLAAAEVLPRPAP